MMGGWARTWMSHHSVLRVYDGRGLMAEEVLRGGLHGEEEQMREEDGSTGSDRLRVSYSVGNVTITHLI